MKRNFKTIELGTTYDLPKYRVIDGQGIKEVREIEPSTTESNMPISIAYQTITFVRGDKTDNGTTIPRVDGITHEQLLSMMIEDIKYKNSINGCRENSIVITKLQEALFWLEERQRDREARSVNGTYKN